MLVGILQQWLYRKYTLVPRITFAKLTFANRLRKNPVRTLVFFLPFSRLPRRILFDRPLHTCFSISPVDKVAIAIIVTFVVSKFSQTTHASVLSREIHVRKI